MTRDPARKVCPYSLRLSSAIREHSVSHHELTSSLKLAAFGMRTASAAAKFLLVLYIANTAASSVLLGQVAIMTTLTALFTQVAGLEVYQVVGRRLHALHPEELVRTLRGQTAACLGSYAILVPIAFIVYPDLLGPEWFCIAPIFILEHFVTEVFRFNILLLRPAYASFLLFVKNIGWVALFVGLTFTRAAQPSFALLLYCWLGVLLVVALPLLTAAWRQHSRYASKGDARASPRIALRLIREALPLMASAVLTAGTGAIDKLMIGKIFAFAELGVYFFFSTCASVLTLVVISSVGATSTPKCVKIHTTQGPEAFMRQLRILKQQYWATTLATAAVILAAVGPLLFLLKKQTYNSHFDILALLVASAAFVSLCDPYKLEEYLAKRDSSLIIGNAFHLASLGVAILITSRTSEITSVAAGVMGSSTLTFLFFLVHGPRRIAQIVSRKI